MLFVFEAAIFAIATPPATSSRASAGVSMLLIVMVALGASLLAADEPIDLQPASNAGAYRQARVIIEVEGKLKLNADGQQVQHLPLKVQGELNYVERVVSQSRQWSEVRLVRTYRGAEAKTRLHESDLIAALRPERRLISVESSTTGASLYCPSGPLTRDELDLLQVPGGELAPESLLAPRAVKIGGQWPLAEATVARLLGLEAISEQDVICTLD